MCYDCGCGMPNDDHGDSEHITEDKLKKLAEKQKVSVEEVKENIKKAL